VASLLGFTNTQRYGGITMIRKKIFVALTLFFLAIAPDVQAARCSNASLKGTYALRLIRPLDSQPSRRGGSKKIQNQPVNQAEKENNRETNI
jgi:hypothetical protein